MSTPTPSKSVAQQILRKYHEYHDPPVRDRVVYRQRTEQGDIIEWTYHYLVKIAEG